LNNGEYEDEVKKEEKDADYQLFSSKIEELVPKDE
jgi:hypothetical protein